MCNFLSQTNAFILSLLEGEIIEKDLATKLTAEKPSEINCLYIDLGRTGNAVLSRTARQQGICFSGQILFVCCPLRLKL